jgi:hypothetical protein
MHCDDSIQFNSIEFHYVITTHLTFSIPLFHFPSAVRSRSHGIILKNSNAQMFLFPVLFLIHIYLNRTSILTSD